MSRKKDPIVGVLQFFETAPLEVASMALALVKATVQRRTPAPVKAKARKRLATPPVSEARPIVLPPPYPPAPTHPEGTPGHRMPHRRRSAPPADVALPMPGIGPATVGD